MLNSLGTRFGIYDKRGTLLVPELSHEDLAEMIGSSRPMVSKLISDMIEEGFLARGEKRHFILRHKERTSTRPTFHDVPAPAHWSGHSKQMVSARDHPIPRQPFGSYQPSRAR